MKEQKDKGLHHGHRERMRDKYLRHGYEHFADHELLELILFYAIPRRDTNEIAHHLLNRFGCLHAVFNAPIAELESVPGMGRSAAVLIHLFMDTYRVIEKDKIKNTSYLNNIHDLGKYIALYFYNVKNEKVILLCLDGKKKVLSCSCVFEGSFNAAQISIKRVVEIAVNMNATFIVIAHNHPNGFAVPSEQDIDTTGRLESALAGIGVILLDHLIFGDNDFISFSESGYIRLSPEVFQYYSLGDVGPEKM